MREPWKSIVRKDSGPTEALRKAYQTFKNEKWLALVGKLSRGTSIEARSPNGMLPPPT